MRGMRIASTNARRNYSTRSRRFGPTRVVSKLHCRPGAEEVNLTERKSAFLCATGTRTAVRTDRSTKGFSANAENQHPLGLFKGTLEFATVKRAFCCTRSANSLLQDRILRK